MRSMPFATPFMMLCFTASLVATLCSFWTGSGLTGSGLTGSGTGSELTGSTRFQSGEPGTPADAEVCAQNCDSRDSHDSQEPALVANPAALAPSELVVDLSDRRVYLYQNQTLQKSYPVAIGKEDWQTPIGVFQVTYKQKNPTWQHPITGEIVPPGPDNPLGAAWIGFWVDGEYQIGFHGTLEEGDIGEAISHGCVRLRNGEILELYDQVQEGWVVTVRP